MRNSNTFLDVVFDCPWHLSWLLVCLGFTIAAEAREPAKALSQYVREQWGTERGFPSGPVYAITQTADGYLWIGTEQG